MSRVLDDLKFALQRRCPVCCQGKIFNSWFSFVPKTHCVHCGTPLKVQDIGDGAVVFLIFILGFTVIPAALIWEFSSSPPIWLQAGVWGVVSLAVIFGLTPVIKAYIMLLQYRHRKADWR